MFSQWENFSTSSNDFEFLSTLVLVYVVLCVPIEENKHIK